MTAASWAALIATFTVAIIVPGPDTFLLLRLGVRNRRAAVLGGFGVMIGNAIWTSVSVLGLAALMRTLPGALPILQSIGSLALIWMGTQSIRGGIAALRLRRTVGSDELGESTPCETASETSGIAAHPLRAGILTNLSNPKALLFFTALFAQLLPADASGLDRLLVFLAFTAIGVAWFTAFALCMSTQSFQRWFGRATPAIDIIAGIVFLAVALGVLVELALALAA